MTMTLLGEKIDVVGDDYVEVESLRFLNDNPRVYACTHGEVDFRNLSTEEQQERIQTRLIEEPSVKNLIPEIKRHEGLIEPILVRQDTREVIEGNSRLAVYRHFRDTGVAGEWDLIPCHIVTGLTPKQQAAFLNQIHVKGKTQWTPYEKANFAYVRKESGWELEEIADLFGESAGTIRKRVRVIELMRENEDREQSHFSHYDVIVRSGGALKALEDKPEFKQRIMKDLREFSITENDGGSDITAQELRRALPTLLTKSRVLNRYSKGTVDLSEACRLSDISPVEEKVRRSTTLLLDVTRSDIEALDPQRFAALKQNVRKLVRESDRTRRLVEDVDHGGP